jgi:hypothetical protein
VKGAASARISGKSLRSILPDLHKELVEKGFVQEGWWETFLKDLGVEI